MTKLSVLIICIIIIVKHYQYKESMEMHDIGKLDYEIIAEVFKNPSKFILSLPYYRVVPRNSCITYCNQVQVYDSSDQCNEIGSDICHSWSR
jgi:hypothetical protein